MKKYPLILKPAFKALKALDNQLIVATVRNIVANEMTVSMLVGNVANALLSLECIIDVNDGSYNFKKALLIRVNIVVKAMKFKFEDKIATTIDKDGNMFTHTTSTIVGQREKEVKTKVWFKEVSSFQDYIILKGSKKKVENNSTKVLSEKAEIDMRIKEIAPEYIDLYKVLLYETNKSKVNEANYWERLQEVAEETKVFLGHTYTNYRKLDSNTRNYSLSRYGFAYDYGDAFEKYLIEPAQEYLVDATEIKYAIKYLENEFKSDDYRVLVKDSIAKINYNSTLLEDYNKGKYVEFTIGHKELGKLLHIVDVFDNIICAEGRMSRSVVGYDFIASGNINASNLWGDEQFLKVANLLGGETKYDAHSLVADYLGIARDEAKLVQQPYMHGATVKPEDMDMVTEIFGESFFYNAKTAEYGRKLAEAGVNSVQFTRVDGVKAVWAPYMLDAQVSMEDGSSIDSIMPFSNSGNGTKKYSGLAVSIVHSSDSATEHYIQMGLHNKGIPVKTILDCFYTKPSALPLIKQLTFESLNRMRGLAEKQLQEIEAQTNIYRGWSIPDRMDIVESYNCM